MPTQRGTSVSQTSSYNISQGLTVIAAEKTFDAEKDIVKTPSVFVTEVSRIARDTLPLACVIIVTPEDKVVGTTQNNAIPCNKLTFKLGSKSGKDKIGKARSGVTMSTSVIPRNKALYCKAAEKDSRASPLITKMTSIATSGRVSPPTFMVFSANPGPGQINPKVITVRRPRMRKFFTTKSWTPMAAWQARRPKSATILLRLAQVLSHAQVVAAMQLINLSRVFDGVVFSAFLLCIGGFGLFLFGELHRMCVITEAKKLGLFANVMNKIFPFPDKKYEFNLTHVMIFSLLIALLSMVHHPAQDVIEQEGEKESKKKKEKKAAKSSKGD